jgi:putative membrane protein
VFFVRLIINTLSLLLVFFLLWHVQGNDAIIAAVVMAVVLALVNAFIRPLVLLLTLPATILTFGLFALVVNALLFWLAAVMVNIHVDFWQAALGWLVFTIVSSALSHLALTDL